MGGGEIPMSLKTRILLVDDDVNAVDALAELLEQQGYEVARAENGQIALTHLRSGPMPSAIILDLMMPVMNGWEFREQQKKIASAAKVPVVVVTASYERTPRDVAAVLSKPVDVGALLRVVSDLCARPAV
jgi:CheY-like chemotaxis protein